MKSTYRPSLRGLKRRSLCLAVAGCFLSHYAYATGTIDNIAHGAATISTAGNVTTIANTPGTIINWHDFSIHNNETVIFNQVNAASAILNRVTGGNMTQILGTLQSNGKVYLINPAGIAIGQNAMIDVAGFVASTLNITDSDFLKGKNNFAADTLKPGSVVNAGKITTPNGGFVYLVAPKVENNGIISAPSGEAILAAGNSVELVDSTDPSQRVTVSANTTDVNLSLLMTQAGGNIFSVLNKGTVSANTISKDVTGRIFFKSAGDIQTTTTSVIEAHGDALSNGGTFIGFADHNGQYAGAFNFSGKNGGYVETSGESVNIDGILLNLAHFDPSGKGGHWLIDPSNFTIDSSVASTINSQLDADASVIIDAQVQGASTGGGIDVQANIEKTTGTGHASLTLAADGQITFDPNIGISNNNGSYHGTLDVSLSSDFNNTGSGGVTFYSGSNINTNGTTIINVNSGDFLLGDVNATAISFIQSQDINLTVAAGNITLQGGSGTGAEARIFATHNLRIITLGNSAPGNITLQGGSGIQTAAGFEAGHDIQIDTSGDITLFGGTGGGAGNVDAQGFFIGSDAYIGADNDIKIFYHSAGKLLKLVAGNAGDNDSATIGAGHDLTIEGIGNNFNPNTEVTGGDSTGDTSGRHGNLAAIVAENQLTLNATRLIMVGGNYNGGTGFQNDIAIVGSTNQAGGSTYGRIDINLTDGTFAGDLTMNNPTAGVAGTAIGNFLGNADITIDAKNILLKDYSGIGAKGYLGGASTGTASTANNAKIDITATGGFSADQSHTFIGSNDGDARIDIVATGDASTGDGFTLANGVKVGHASTGTGHVNITGTGYSGSSGGSGVVIRNSFISAYNGDININATSHGSGSNCCQDGAFLESASISTNTGNINITGDAFSTGSDSVGIEIVTNAVNNTLIHSSSGDIKLMGSAVDTTGTNSNGIWIASSLYTEISTDSGDIRLEGSSNVNENIHFTNPNLKIYAMGANGDISIRAKTAEMDISGADIRAGHDLTLHSENGAIAQPTGSITVGNKVTAQATNGINLASSNNTLTKIDALTGSGGVTLGTQNDLEATIAAASGDINVSVTNGGNLNVNGSFYTTSGNVTVTADGNITGNSVASIESQSGGTVSLTSNNGGIDMTGGARIVGGTVSLEANGPIKASVNAPNISAATNNQSILINSISAAHNMSLITGTDGAGTADIQVNLLNGLASGANNISLRTFGLSTLKGNLVSNGGATLIDNLDGSLDILADTINLAAGSAINTEGNLEIFANTIDLNTSFISTNSGDITIGTNALTMDHTTIQAPSGSIDMLIKDSLTMNNRSTILADDININSLPLAFSLASDQATAQKITQLFTKLNKNAVFNINESAIRSYNNLNIAASEINLVGGRLVSDNTTSIFDIKGLTLTGGAQSSRIYGGSETLIVSGGPIVLGSGTSLAKIEAGSADSIFLSFPLLSTDGFIVDGVANAITSSTNSATGFFANGSPAILDQNLHVTYGGLGGEVATFLNHAFKESTKSDSLVLPDNDKNKKAKSQRECGA